ncbi:MAG TPA: hypothetical protein VGL64_15320 [Amycolatopsis sp.]|jgi:hypothetical protein
MQPRDYEDRLPVAALNLDETKSSTAPLADPAGEAVEGIIEALIPNARAAVADSPPPPLPIAKLITPRREGSLVYAMVRVDRSGRLVDKAVLDAVSWRAEERISVRLAPGVIVFQPQPTGLLAVNKHQCVTIPAAARHHFEIRPGHRVLMAGIPEHRVILVYPLSTVDVLISQFHASVGDGA